MDGAMGTRWEIDDGVYTGRLDGPFAYGEGKARAAARVRRRARHRPGRSRGPTPTRRRTCRCCEAVGHPVAVNPDAGLAEVAKREGWEVLRFEKLGERLRVAAAVAGRRRGRRQRQLARRPPRAGRVRIARSGAAIDWAMAVEPEAMRRAHEWLKEVYARQPERDALFTTISGEQVKPLYTQEDLAENDAERDIGYPGEYPFTRGVYPSMYRGRLWTMRQFAGFGTAEETNERFRYLLDHGQTGPLDRLRHADADGPRLRQPPLARARSGARAWRSTRSTTWRPSSPASRSARSRRR